MVFYRPYNPAGAIYNEGYGAYHHSASGALGKYTFTIADVQDGADMWYRDGIQTFGSVIDITKNPASTHPEVNLWGQLPYKYHIGHMHVDQADYGKWTFVPKDHISLSNSPAWQHLRDSHFQQTNVNAMESPLIETFPTSFVLRLTKKWKQYEEITVEGTYSMGNKQEVEDPNLDLDDVENLEVETVLPYKELWKPLQDIDDWVQSTETKYPTIETTLCMVHCDRFIESDTRGQYRQEARLNL